jgi:hypothetical protein
MTATEHLIKAKGFIEDAIESVYNEYKNTKGRKERAEMRMVFEELVRMDTRRCGFRRWIQLR